MVVGKVHFLGGCWMGGLSLFTGPGLKAGLNVLPHGLCHREALQRSSERARKEVPDETCSLFITLSWV